ncbi:hypothetical protein HMPREF1978_01867, partial [Actinomyces graevenitzii F0530]
FPAHAGMSPGRNHTMPIYHGFPRSRGDEPRGQSGSGWLQVFSPLTRG